jgi:hypothetical protein
MFRLIAISMVMCYYWIDSNNYEQAIRSFDYWTDSGYRPANNDREQRATNRLAS